MRNRKRWLAAILLALAAMLALTGCDASVQTIRLRGNRSKGYTWDYESAGDPAVDEVERHYEDGNIPGTTDAPGIFYFTFEGKNPGSAKLYFKYFKEGDDGEDYLSSIVYEVQVDSEGRIVECRPVGATLTEAAGEAIREAIQERAE